jgi:hypothetical protein
VWVTHTKCRFIQIVNFACTFRFILQFFYEAATYLISSTRATDQSWGLEGGIGAVTPMHDCRQIFLRFGGTRIQSCKMEVACSSETMVSAYKTAWCHNPEVHSLKSGSFLDVKNISQQFTEPEPATGLEPEPWIQST